MDSLKDVCESSLQTLVDADTTVALLSIADHYNAFSLKVSGEDIYLYLI